MGRRFPRIGKMGAEGRQKPKPNTLISIVAAQGTGGKESRRDLNPCLSDVKVWGFKDNALQLFYEPLFSKEISLC